jgi:hypothetical protein
MLNLTLPLERLATSCATHASASELADVAETEWPKRMLTLG